MNQLDPNAVFDKNDPGVQSLLIECMNSFPVFCKTLFPYDVRSEYSLLHKKMFTVFDDPTHKKKAVAAPRGIGKTTHAKLRAVKAILFREVPFIVYLSNTVTSAIEQTEHIKRMLQEELVEQMFGKVTFSKKGFREGFSKESWVAFGEVYVLPRGQGQQIRGKNWMGHRPGLVIIDDLEDAKEVRNPDNRTELKRWFFSDLMKTEDFYGNPTEFLYIDTIKHEDSLLQNLVDYSDWHSVVLSICDKEFNTYDPNYMTTEQIKEAYEAHKESGETDLFYMEFMNIPISLEDAVFKPETFKYFEERGEYLLTVQQSNELPPEKVRVRDLITVVLVDPARTVKMQSADSAIVVVSVDRREGRIFVREVISEKFRPDELYDAMFTATLMYNAHLLCVELTGLHEFIEQPILNEIRVRGVTAIYIGFNTKKGDGEKDRRISSMAMHYRRGYVYHNKANCTVLENQLIWHPKAKEKDAADAFSFLNKIMDDYPLYFDPYDDEEFEDEYEGLEFDDLPPLEVNTRLI